MPARLSGVSQWSRYLEPWYGPYAVVGAVVSGGIPILLPLAVIGGGSPRHVGLAIAAFNAGTIMAPTFVGSSVIARPSEEDPQGPIRP